MNRFDDIIAEKLNAADYAPDAQVWKGIEKSLDATSAAPSANGTGFKVPFWSGVAATVALVGFLEVMPPASEQTKDTVLTTSTLPTASHALPVEEVGSTVNDVSAPEPQRLHEIELEVIDQNAGRTAASSNTNDQASNDIPAHSEEVATSVTDEGADESASLANELSIRATGIQCPGSMVTFEADGPKSALYRWVIDGIHVEEGQAIDVRFEEAGLHEVVLFAETDAQSISTRRSIEIFELPETRLTYDIEENRQCFQQKVVLSGEPGSHAYHWTVDEQKTSGTTVQTMLSQGVHHVAVQVVNHYGCTSEQRLMVDVKGGLILPTPNAFSPDNNGKNDVWEVRNIKHLAQHTLEIYRLQDNMKVFETTQGKVWDGSIAGTSEQAQDGEIFIYKLLATDHCGVQQEYNGQITVVKQ